MKGEWNLLWESRRLMLSLSSGTMTKGRQRETMAAFTMAVIASLSVVSASDEVLMRDCHSTDPRPYIYHATKTPYELINNEDSSPIFVAGI